MKTLAFMQTHIISPAIIEEFKKLKASKNVKSILVVDNEKLRLEDNGEILQTKEFFGEKVLCFLYDEKKFRALNLPFCEGYNANSHNFAGVMWFNVDYIFYLLRANLKEFEYFWRVEYDCFFNGENYGIFFDEYVKNSSDLLILGLRKESWQSKWCWVQNVSWAYDKNEQLWGSFLPVERISARALDILYKKRLFQGQNYKNFKDKKQKQWIFGELFIPTECARANLSMQSLGGLRCGLAEIDLNESRIFEKPDNLIYHPIKGNFLKRLAWHHDNAKKLNAKIAENEKNYAEKYLAISCCKEHLAYRLAQVLIFESKSFLGFVRMPFVLSYEYARYKRSRQEARSKLSRPLNEYEEVRKIQNQFSYQLGLEFIKACKTWYKGGFVRFYFALKKLKMRKNKA